MLLLQPKSDLVCVDDPSEDLLGCFPYPISGQPLLKTCRILDLPWYGRGDLLEGAERKI